MKPSILLYDYATPKINSLVFKLTDYCNQGCNYCYRENNKELPQKIMSDDIIFKTIEKYISFLKSTCGLNDTLYLIWHGGEPLLAGLEKFKRIIEIEEYFSEKENISFENAVQTNGILLDENWADFLERNNFLVGFSIDGPKHIHDIHRCNKNKDSTFDLTMKGLAILKKRNVKLNIISVITNESAEYVEEIYNFTKNSGVESVDFIPCFYYNDRMTLEPQKYVNSMLEILNFWKNDDFDFVTIRFLNDIFKRVVYKDSNRSCVIECELAGSCGQNFSIGVAGEIYPCECLTPMNDMELGNIMSNTFSECFESTKFCDFKEKFNDIPGECFECEVFEICRAGCMNRRLRIHNLNRGKDLYCDARKKLITEVQNIVNEKMNDQMKEETKEQTKEQMKEQKYA